MAITPLQCVQGIFHDHTSSDPQGSVAPQAAAGLLQQGAPHSTQGGQAGGHSLPVSEGLGFMSWPTHFDAESQGHSQFLITPAAMLQQLRAHVVPVACMLTHFSIMHASTKHFHRAYTLGPHFHTLAANKGRGQLNQICICRSVAQACFAILL